MRLTPICYSFGNIDFQGSVEVPKSCLLACHLETLKAACREKRPNLPPNSLTTTGAFSEPEPFGASSDPNRPPLVLKKVCCSFPPNLKIAPVASAPLLRHLRLDSSGCGLAHGRSRPIRFWLARKITAVDHASCCHGASFWMYGDRL